MVAQSGQLTNSPHRMSVSLTPEQHKELVQIARQKKVSVAWVVREAIERLLRDEMPLLYPVKE